MSKKTKREIPAEIRESAHKVWLAGLGALSLAEEEGSKLFNNLVKKGESFEKRGKKQIEKVQDQIGERVGEAKERAETVWGKLGSSFDERVAATLKRLGVPTRVEIQKLTKRVEQLTEKVDQLKPKSGSTRATKSA